MDELLLLKFAVNIHPCVSICTQVTSLCCFCFYCLNKINIRYIELFRLYQSVVYTNPSQLHRLEFSR